jgi:hypothetical protein
MLGNADQRTDDCLNAGYANAPSGSSIALERRHDGFRRFRLRPLPGCIRRQSGTFAYIRYEPLSGEVRAAWQRGRITAGATIEQMDPISGAR